jgi:two-component system, cell cycle response regulator
VNNQVLEQACPLLDGDKVSIGATTILKFTCHRALQPTVSRHAHRDPLTQAYRLEYFEEHLRAELSFSRRHHTALSLVMFDIDRFALLRDRVGADVTDRILAEVARAAAALVANQHLFARIGTRSFAILSRTLTGGQARALAERIRQDVAGVPFALGGDLVEVTIRAGVAALPVEGIDTTLAFTRLADYALGDAKTRGRNRVVLAGDDTEEP